MSEQDRQKWNAKYTHAAAASSEPSVLLTSLDDLLPRSGRALDVAGGAGRHTIWLARRGLDVTLADISDGGIALARQRGRAVGLKFDTLRLDFEENPFPQGPWDLIISFHFLWRPLFQVFPHILSRGGILTVVQPTRSNLQRHDKPPERFLLQDGELPTLVHGLNIIRYEEGWLAEGRHDALLVAQRP